MITSFPGSPQVRRGALVGLDPLNPLASICLFQYNPDTVQRTLQARSAGAESGARSEAQRLSGAPIETLRLEVEIDATDQLDSGDPLAEALGIYPQLSALEMLLYPKSSLVIANTVAAFAGTIEILPPESPLTLLVWGTQRVLPVRLGEFSINEQAHDPNLNPIRASVTLGLRVLSYTDLSVTSPGYYIFLAHQVIKESMATIAGRGTVASAASADILRAIRGV